MSQLAASPPLVGVVMGSRYDWDTMQHAVARLEQLGVPHEVRWCPRTARPTCCSSTPKAPRRAACARSSPAPAAPRTCRACSRPRPPVPVLGVPVQSKALNGLDSLLSIVQMPAGVPVATFAIGAAGAANAGAVRRRACLPPIIPACAPALDGLPRHADRRTCSTSRIRAPAMTTVGILGGGQLARMLALSGAPLGLRFLRARFRRRCLRRPVRAAARRPTTATKTALAEFARAGRRGDLRLRERAGRNRAAGWPNASRCSRTRARWRWRRTGSRRRTLFRELGIPVPDFADVDSPRRRSMQAIARIGAPAILKTRRLGYDGKGQFRIKTRRRCRCGLAGAGRAGRKRRADPGGLRAVPARGFAWSRCAAATASSAPGR